MDDSPVAVYDTRLVQIQSYTMGDSSTVGSKGLQVDAFNHQWPPTNYIGFAFD